jgi:hypothetical protein
VCIAHTDDSTGKELGDIAERELQPKVQHSLQWTLQRLRQQSELMHRQIVHWQHRELVCRDAI